MTPSGTAPGAAEGAPAVTPADAAAATAAAVDWAALTAAARAVKDRAYAPYSRFHVGAAALVDDGRTVVGCNVENASYGLGLCAECTMVGDLVVGGGGTLVAVVCVGPEGEPVMPCGRCRQVLWEHSTDDTMLATARGVLPMREVLPDAFGPRDLVERTPGGAPGLSTEDGE